MVIEPPKKGELNMIKHNISKYRSNNQLIVTSWLQINLFGKVICFSKKSLYI